MADRSSAYLFGEIFSLIADEIEDAETQRRLARKFWKMSFDYDFSPYQMESDKVLLSLGLAKKQVDPRYPEDGPVMMYADAAGKRFEP